jgi:PAS domain-containing protein
MRRADGVYRWLRAQSAPLKDADGRVLRWYNLITDIEDVNAPRRLFSPVS